MARNWSELPRDIRPTLDARTWEAGAGPARRERKVLVAMRRAYGTERLDCERLLGAPRRARSRSVDFSPPWMGREGEGMFVPALEQKSAVFVRALLSLTGISACATPPDETAPGSQGRTRRAARGDAAGAGGWRAVVATGRDAGRPDSTS